ESKFFRGVVSERRCLVSMMGWFERSRERRRDYRFAPKRPEPEATKPFACAGVWSTAHDEQGNTFRSFAILTTVANDSALPIHPPCREGSKRPRRGRAALAPRRPSSTSSGNGGTTPESSLSRKPASFPGPRRSP